MARLIVGSVFGLMVGVVVGAACGLKAQPEIDEDTVAAADTAGVDAIELQGAVNTTGLPPAEYLYAVGELARPAVQPACGWPICGPLGQRIFCVEAIESGHGRAMYNPTPWYGQHAQGFLGWLPTTARAWGAIIGDRASEWAAAARMFATLSPRALGTQFYGVGAGLC